MKLYLTPLPELNARAYDILCKHMGIADTLRFWTQAFGEGNYTEERKVLFEELKIDEVCDEIERSSDSK